jgi:hypothetical protein
MGPNRKQQEAEERQLDDDLASGAIDMKEYNRQVREMERDYREDAREAARGAYDREMENW